MLSLVEDLAYILYRLVGMLVAVLGNLINGVTKDSTVYIPPLSTDYGFDTLLANLITQLVTITSHVINKLNPALFADLVTKLINFIAAVFYNLV